MANFLRAEHERDFSKGKDLFAEDAFFNGMLFKKHGWAEITELYVKFVAEELLSIRIEAITEISESKFLVLWWALVTGNEKEMPACELFTTRDGKISRIDNCFDLSKVPQRHKDDAAKEGFVE